MNNTVDLAPLFLIVDLYFDNKILKEIKDDNIVELFKSSAIDIVNNYLSRIYIKKHLNLFFTDECILFIIFTRLKEKYLSIGVNE